MESIDRRRFTQATLTSLLTYSLLESLCQADAFASEIQPVAASWLAEINRMSADLKGAKLTPVQWQAQVDQLSEKVDVPELLKFIDFQKLTQNLAYRDRGEKSLTPKFPEVEGLPTQRVYGQQLFALKKGASVVPHGHDNMATCFIVLQGEFHGRHYDRLQDEGEHMIIKPTIDRMFPAGGHSSISDDKDNVHWFRATQDASFIFNIHVLGVKPGNSGRVYIDPMGEPLEDGRIRARRISSAECYRLYG
jgi:hypothetical protein